MVWHPTDPVELGRVLQNLFENARRYGRSSDTGIARVLVTYARTGPWVILTVRDHGPGVPAGSERIIFEKFTRGEKESATTGVGLGLAQQARPHGLGPPAVVRREHPGAVRADEIRPAVTDPADGEAFRGGPAGGEERARRRVAAHGRRGQAHDGGRRRRRRRGASS